MANKKRPREIPATDLGMDLEKGPPYAGHAGGAVGRTPAEGHASGGTIRGGLAPQSGNPPADTTIGHDPDAVADHGGTKHGGKK